MFHKEKTRYSSHFTPHSVRIPTELKPSLSGYRIGVDYCWAKQADPSIFNAFCESIDFLRDQGATVVDFRMPDLDYLNTSHLITFISEIGQVSLGKWTLADV